MRSARGSERRSDCVATAVTTISNGLSAARASAAGRRAWTKAWPPLGATAVLIAGWQAVVWSGWRPDYLLPGPVAVFARLGQDLRDPDMYAALLTTGTRAAVGFSLALVLRLFLGLA